MGFSISWLAVRGRGKADVLKSFELHETGETDEFPDSPVSGTALPDGAYLIFLNDCFHRFVTPEFLTKVSKGCEILGCQVEEHVMASAAFFWRNGKRVWNLVHEADRGLYDLQIEGSLPDPFSSIRDEQTKTQDAEGEDAGVDYMFDIPVKLATALSGFAHDRVKFDWGKPVFARLREGKLS